MTKSDFIQAIADKLNLPAGKSELIVDAIFGSMAGALKRGDRIELRGFGTFEVRHYKSYQGRNPKTGEVVDVKAKRLPFFKVSNELRERVNREPSAQVDQTRSNPVS